MASYRGLVGAGLVIGILSGMPCFAQTEMPLGTFVVPLSPAKKEVQPVGEWSKQTLGLVNTIWTEGNEAKRQQKLFEWAEQTPAQLAYVTRILKKNDVQQTGTIIVTLKDLFDLFKRVNWQAGDQPHMQRIVATWSAIVPQLVKTIPLPELPSSQRRNLGTVFVEIHRVAARTLHALRVGVSADCLSFKRTEVGVLRSEIPKPRSSPRCAVGAHGHRCHRTSRTARADRQAERDPKK